MCICVYVFVVGGGCQALATFWGLKVSNEKYIKNCLGEKKVIS